MLTAWRLHGQHMNTTDIATVARYLLRAEGPRAIAEAGREAESCTKRGDSESARFWSRVEAVLREMRGPLQG